MTLLQRRGSWLVSLLCKDSCGSALTIQYTFNYLKRSFYHRIEPHGPQDAMEFNSKRCVKTWE